MQYKLVACAGTFDLLHKGHRAFLQYAFSLGKHVLIGLTTDEFIVKAKKQRQVASYEIRKNVLESFLQHEKLIERARIFPLNDIYGPTLDNTIPIEALVVTANTKENAEVINRERNRKNLKEIPIVLMNLVTTEQKIISSSAIRNGIMNQNGELFITDSLVSKDLLLPEFMREKLHKPFGMILDNPQNLLRRLSSEVIITVGDVTTSKFNQWGINQKLSIIDFTVERKKLFNTIKELGFTGNEIVVPLKNSAGIITKDVWQVMSNVVHRLPEHENWIILVEGEEDLLVIPLLLYLPLGFHIFYGQPHHGLVHVEVTLEAKEAMKKIIREFEPKTTRGY